MKRIIVCLDNDKHAACACEYAIYIAKILKSEILFVHVKENFEVNDEFYGLAAAGMVVYDDNSQVKEDSKAKEQEAVEILNSCQKKAQEAGIKADILLKDGEFLDILKDFKDETELFICGIRSDNREDFELGLNSEMLIKEFGIPVLLINGGFREIKSVLVAFDESPCARKAVEFLAKSSVFNGVKKHILNINDDEENSERILNIAKEILKDENAIFVTKSGKDTTEAILQYRRENDLDLVISGAFSKNFFTKLFKGSVFEGVIEKARVAILALA